MTVADGPFGVTNEIELPKREYIYILGTLINSQDTP